MLESRRARAVMGAGALHLMGFAALWLLSAPTPRTSGAPVVSVSLVAGGGQGAAGPAPVDRSLESLGRRLSEATPRQAPTDGTAQGLSGLLGAAPSSAALRQAAAGGAGTGRSDPYLHASGARLAREHQMEAALRRAADRCWDRPSEPLAVRVRVSLDAHGAPRGVPVPVDPSDGSPGRRDAERRAASAVAACAPYDLPILDGAPQTVELTF